MSFGPSAVPASANAFKDCDVMLAVGTRFAEIATGSYGAVPPEKLIHIDINGEAIGANHNFRCATGTGRDTSAFCGARADQSGFECPVFTSRST